MNTRHITRFTYTFTNFQGWRVAITRQGVALARYFSDRQYGDAEASREQALSFRDMVLAELATNPEQTQAILMKHRVTPRKVYPAGLKPAPTTTPAPAESPACSMRSNKVLHNILRGVCRRLQLDTASVLKLSLYLFTLQYGTTGAHSAPEQKQPALHADASLPENDEPDLQHLITELETRALQAGLPCFEEFATGRRSSSIQPHNTEEQKKATFAQQRNDIGACDNSHAAERYMRSSHPSPPQNTSAPPMQHTHTSSPSASLSSFASSGHPPHSTEAIWSASSQIGSIDPEKPKHTAGTQLLPAPDTPCAPVKATHRA